LNELLLVLVGILLAMTAGAAVEYYRRLRSAKKEYEKAREAVEDIVVSFNRQFRQEAEKLELVAYKLEAVSSKSDNALKKAEEVEKKMPDLISRISTVVEDRQKAVSSLEEIDRKVRDVAVSQEALVARLSTIEEQARQLSLAPEAKIEAVIPIKREKALAPLTETELSALEMLALEGPKTAPDIKERIKLSREHTSRLMKKLYEGGYLERDTTKIPFKYRVKEEMSKLLKKTETSAT
jgi:predicted HTH transcriptional regulator